MIRSVLAAVGLLVLPVVASVDQPVRAEASTWAVAPSCDLLVAVNGARDGLLKIDTAGKSSEVKLGDFPFDIVVSQDGKYAYVSGFAENTLHVVDLTTMTKVVSIPLAVGPNGLEISPDGRKVYAAVAGGIDVVDTNTRKLERLIQLDDTPYDVVLSPDGNFLFASMWFGGKIIRFDIANNTSTSVSVPTKPGLMAISADGNKVFVTHQETDQITRIDTATMTATSATVGDQPRGIDISPDGKTLYVVDQGSRTLSIVDATSLSRRTVAVGDGAFDVTLDATGLRAYVNNYFNDSVSIIDTATAKVVGTVSLGSKSESWNMETVCPAPAPFTRPGTINDLFIFANFFCGPCTNAWVLFTRPAGTTDFEVVIDGRRATCANKGYFYDLALCELKPLTPGRTSTIGVVPVNGSIRGSTASMSLTLRA
jgi:YVTN family beta-propeller protein